MVTKIGLLDFFNKYSDKKLNGHPRARHKLYPGPFFMLKIFSGRNEFIFDAGVGPQPQFTSKNLLSSACYYPRIRLVYGILRMRVLSMKHRGMAISETMKNFMIVGILIDSIKIGSAMRIV